MRRSTAAILIALMLAVPSAVRAAVVPLTPEQRTQLADTPDLTREIDAGGLYALLRNAGDWQLSGEVEGLTPDFAAIYAEPSTYRGEAFRIEGRLARAVEAGRSLSRPGPWDGKLQRWVILPVDTQIPVIVYLIDAGELDAAPSLRTPLRAVGRFYTVYESKNGETPPSWTKYLVFVGQRAQVIDEAALGAAGAAAPMQSTASEGESSEKLLMLVGLVLAAFAFAAFRMRKLIAGPRPLPSQVRRHRERDEHDEDEALDEDALPEDPEQALETLAQRHEHARDAAFAKAAANSGTAPVDDAPQQ